jgi:hypothetical protein
MRKTTDYSVLPGTGKKKNTKAEEIVSTLQVDTTIEKRHNHAKSPKRFQEL